MSLPKVIGLVGQKHSGKDTFYKLCLELYLDKRLEYCPYRYAFADALKQEVADKHGITIEELNKNKEKYRIELQETGVKHRDIEKGHWIDKLADSLLNFKMKGPSLILITDVRFVNEAFFVRDLHGKLIRIHRRSSENDIDSHISETEQRQIICDDFIDNNESELRYKMLIQDTLRKLL